MTKLHQIIVMTSDVSQDRVLPGFLWSIDKHWPSHPEITVVGFSRPSGPATTLYTPKRAKFHSLGSFSEYPAHRWSDAMMLTLDTVTEETFLLLLDDYWLTRPVDGAGVDIMFAYMEQFRNVLKFDVARDRLYADPGGYVYDFNTYNHAGHLDLIKSKPGTPYHMSLWGGIWRRDLMREFLVPGETAQQIELNGTARVSQAGDSVLILGSRQGPLLHGNILQGGKSGPVFADGGWKIDEGSIGAMEELGILPQ